LIVVDASIFVAWLLNEPMQSTEQEVWEALVSESALVPVHWPNEVANALRRAVRRNRISLEDIGPTLEDLAPFDIKLSTPPSVQDIEALTKDALRLDLSVYDLQYVNLAKTHRLPLATIDAAIRSAAHKVDVIVLPQSR
jgi:predicted nucleic acid-binding protein